MLDVVRRATNHPQITASRFPWWMTALIAPFNETLRELRKMRYLWKTPIQLDDRKLVAFLGGKPYTRIDDAIRTTLTAMGSMPEQSHVGASLA
jgi:hypothetical protein